MVGIWQTWLESSGGLGFDGWRQPSPTLSNHRFQPQEPSGGQDSNPINCPGGPVSCREMCVFLADSPTTANRKRGVVDWIPTESTPGAVFGDDTFFGFREQLFFDEGVKLLASELEF